MLKRLLGLVVLLTLGLPSVATAQPDCLEWDELGRCIFRYSDLSSGSGQSDGGSDEYSGGTRDDGNSRTGSRVCTFRGSAIPCETALGTWSDYGSAWCRVASPQPPLTDAVWEGRTEGLIYACTRPGFNLTPDPNLTANRWLPGPPEAVQVDPRQVAIDLLARLDLEAVDLGMFPKGDNDVRLGFVGWNTWLWAEAPSAKQWGPVSASDSGSGVTVSLTAEVDSVEWDMGDGAVVSCGKGTPWSEARTQGGKNVASPDCGHVYESMGTYEVTATSNWNVQWSGAGQSGTLPFSLSRSASYLVGEYQAVNG